ncbi:MAG: DUF1576 domain-containing protein [Fervidobacterium sp.]
MGNLSIPEQISKIVTSPDYLIADYLEIAGIGGAFLNSGLLMLIFTLLLKFIGISPSGVSIAAVMTIGGFALFGKNVFNVWPIVLGVFLYTFLVGENMKTYLYVAYFGTALAPFTTHLVISKGFDMIGFLMVIFVGFLLPPLASFSLTLHRGYNLYNVGFTAGILGMVLGALLKAYNLEPPEQFYWHTENQVLLSIFIYAIFFFILTFGLKLNNWTLNGYKNLLKYSGKLITDFPLLENEAVTFINIGILGLFGTTYVLMIGSSLNGPTIGGIMTLAGFGAFGKHPKNIVPVIIGILIGAITNAQPMNSASMVLAVLFGTTLAPIAGEFGIFWGIIAGFLHSALVLNTSFLHHGLNLYNNGLSGGLIAIFLIPLIEAAKVLSKNTMKQLKAIFRR